MTIDGGWYDMTNASNSAKALFGESGAASRAGLALGVRPLGDVCSFAAADASSRRRASASSWTRRAARSSPSATPVDVKCHPLCTRCSGIASSRAPALRPYIAAGAGAALYDEESEIAGEILESSATKPMGMAVVGADYGRGRVRSGIEAGYSLVPDTIGTGGVSEFYEEDDVAASPPWAGSASCLARLLERDQDSEVLGGGGGEEPRGSANAFHQVTQRVVLPVLAFPDLRIDLERASSPCIEAGAQRVVGPRGQHLVRGPGLGRGQRAGGPIAHVHVAHLAPAVEQEARRRVAPFRPAGEQVVDAVPGLVDVHLPSLGGRERQRVGAAGRGLAAGLAPNRRARNEGPAGGAVASKVTASSGARIRHPAAGRRAAARWRRR